MDWHTLTVRDVLAIALASILVGGVLYLVIRHPHRGDNWGFDKTWDCTNPGSEEPVCIKKRTAH